MIDLSSAPDTFYTIHTKAGKEREAAFNLERQGAVVFAPFRKNTRYFTRNPNYKTLPAFPRYIFAAFDFDSMFARVRSTRGVTGFVQFGSEIGSVDKRVLQIVIEHSKNSLVDFSFFDTSPSFRYAIGEIMKVTFGDWIDSLVEVIGHELNGEYLVTPFVEPLNDGANHLNLAGLLKKPISERHLERLAVV